MNPFTSRTYHGERPTGERRRRTYGRSRTCAEPGCTTRLSIYNKRDRCFVHTPARVFVGPRR